MDEQLHFNLSLSLTRNKTLRAEIIIADGDTGQVLEYKTFDRVVDALVEFYRRMGYIMPEIREQREIEEEEVDEGG